jgi:hypothetical protein
MSRTRERELARRRASLVRSWVWSQSEVLGVVGVVVFVGGLWGSGSCSEVKPVPRERRAEREVARILGVR